MNRAHHVIADRVRGEMEDLDRAAARSLQRWEHALRVPEQQDAYLESTALNLQSLYTGVERVFTLVAERLDGRLPAGETWHRDLLRQMTEGVPGIRPALISAETAIELDELMRFRHLVRNIYAERLISTEMIPMMRTLPPLWARLRQELNAFLEFLDS